MIKKISFSLQHEGLAVAVLGRVDLDHDKTVVLDDNGEVVHLQNDDVLIVHLELLECLLWRVVEADEVSKVILIILDVLVERVGIWKMVVVRSGGVIRFLKEAEISIIVVIVFLLSFWGELYRKEWWRGMRRKGEWWEREKWISWPGKRWGRWRSSLGERTLIQRRFYETVFKMLIIIIKLSLLSKCW